ncbi:hypothetical protein PR048_012222 [Dryococelus australis]|uniref:Site-specific DNA endonuclease n=1 Tax=Dryococelus australis TaxID=614101 RepID=A0ABQ9HNX9_9NEOP|nr:hypothetical protein PR048_012222 [Dryococelus australis]
MHTQSGLLKRYTTAYLYAVRIARLPKNIQRNENDWSTNILKKKRNKGEGYISTKGKIIPAHEMKPPCKETCRLQCHTKYTQDQRVTKIEPIQKSMRKRANNFAYYLTVSGRKVRVSKTFFLNTLGVSERYAYIAWDKLDELGIVGPDNRGKHSNHRKTDVVILEGIRRHTRSFPVIDSHYLRTQTRRLCLDGSLSISQLYRLYKEKCSTTNETDFDGHDFKTVNLRQRRRGCPLSENFSLTPAHITRPCISSEKKKDLLSICCDGIISSAYHEFYLSLPTVQAKRSNIPNENTLECGSK